LGELTKQLRNSKQYTFKETKETESAKIKAKEQTKSAEM